MPLQPGVRLGSYEVVSLLGSGGMGEVYKARDTRLDRAVAIKVLPQAATNSVESLTRLRREAKTLAALHHPHICTLHDVGSDGDVHFLIMELLEGETLAARLARGPLSIAEALRHAIEIGDALDQAHRHGVIHRDLKPANVFLTRSGESKRTVIAKLLDFGIATSARQVVPMGAADQVETSSGFAAPVATNDGVIAGTLPYMAPEQLEGRDADVRSDIFAFGALLFEMLTGRPAFSGTSGATVMAAVVREDPPPVSLIHPVPILLDHLVQTCLAKDPEERWQSIRDVVMQLRIVSAQSDGPVIVAKTPMRRQLLWTGAAALAALLMSLTAWSAFRRSSTAPTSPRFSSRR